MAGKNAQTKERFWSAGVSALEAIGGPHAYCCPLCLKLFNKEHLDKLTFEHVPPQALGGKRLFLTCHDCNSRRGHKPDAHARAEKDVLEFVRGGNHPPLPARLTEQQVNVELSRDGDTNIIRFLPSNNKPGAQAGLIRDINTWRDGSTIEFEIRRPWTQRYASVSYLRSSYLITFAWLGYRWALGSSLEMVRKQILSYDETHLGLFEMLGIDWEPERIVIIPEWRGIAVTHQYRMIFLPIFSDDVAFYERIAGHHLRATCRRFAWPPRAMYELDHVDEDALRAFCSLGWARPSDP